MKHPIFILSILGLILLTISGIIFKKIKSQKAYENDFKNSLKYLKDKFDMSKYEAEKLEQQYRLETAHFKSGQFINTFSPGMEKFGVNYPYGWISLNNFFWKAFPEHKPIKGFFYKGIEGGTGLEKTFLKFRNLTDAMATTLANARLNGGNFAAWYSKDPMKQDFYLKSLNLFIPKIANNVYS